MFYAQKRRGGAEILGSNGIIMLDGRWSRSTAHRYVVDQLGKYNLDCADAYQLFKGEKFSNSHAVSPIVRLSAHGSR